MSEDQKLTEYQKLIEQNQVLADYIRKHNLTDKEIKKLNQDGKTFFIKVLSNPTLYDKLRQEVYDHLRTL
jgi:hypothetical protein